MSKPKRQTTQIHHERRQKLILQSALVGAIAGFIAVLFEKAVGLTEHLSQSFTTGIGLAGYFVIPLASALLGAVVAHVTKEFAPEAAGSGIPNTKLVLMNLRQMRPWRMIPIKIFGGLGAIAAGMSLGREGPSVQIGAGIGHMFAKAIRAPRRSFSILIASGSGAGLAAAFNAPLAGFLFVMEELKRDMSPLTYGTALISSVCAVAIKRLMVGQQPSLVVRQANFVPLSALFVVAIVGAAGALVGVLFNRSILTVMAFRDRIRLPRWGFGASVGMLAGLTLCFAPLATGSGVSTIQKLLDGGFGAPAIGLLATVLLVKFLLTVLSFSSGVPGGIFAPLLAMGALIGTVVGILAHLAFPAIGVLPSVFATIGMAAFLSASVRTPLTGVVLIFEMTSEYRLLYPLLISAFVAYIIAEFLRDRPIYEALVERELHITDEVLPGSEPPKVVDLYVEPDSVMDGIHIRSLKLPPGCLVVNIQRGSGYVVPNGSTRLFEGDVVTVVSEVIEQAAWASVFDLARSPLGRGAPNAAYQEIDPGEDG